MKKNFYFTDHVHMSLEHDGMTMSLILNFSSFAISCFPLVSAAAFSREPLAALQGRVSKLLVPTPGASSNIH